MATIVKADDTAVTQAQAEKIIALGLTEEGAIEYGADDCRARWVQTGLLVVWASTGGKGWKADKEWLLAEDGGLTELCVGCHHAECKCAGAIGIMP